MASHDETQAPLSSAINTALSAMILSHSGWRGIFAADGDEESRTEEIGAAHRIIAAGAATAFAGYLFGAGNGGGKPLVLIGCDTRPTGKAIAEAMIPALTACGCKLRYTGVAAAPEIMAWARSLAGESRNTGFIYISASHNPIGHNGFKFGLTDGGVLPAEETSKLKTQFLSLMAEPENIQSDSASLDEIITAGRDNKKEAMTAYLNFSAEVAWGSSNTLPQIPLSSILIPHLLQHPLGICCDFNGSARSASIDREFFEGLGIRFEAINAEPGNIIHRIVPEGEALEPCRNFLEKIHSLDPAFVLGYVPDCDGDRGNLVIWDETLHKARALEAQEVFALACIAELAWLTRLGSLPPKTAIAVNDPTSLRIDRIAGFFGASVFRAEVGEANVVGLARRLRGNGYTVRILGEGSNGGNITHPSAVRDPLHTALALVKLLSIRTEAGKPGLFELWCNAACQNQRYHSGFSLSDVMASLPPFITTEVSAPEASLRITGSDHAGLKNRYQHIFLREWEERKKDLKVRYGIYGWEAAAYNGLEERKGIANFGEARNGGLKICFTNRDGRPIASLWMRGSATEPVFRIMADAEGYDKQFERELIEWQRRMVMEAAS